MFKSHVVVKAFVGRLAVIGLGMAFLAGCCCPKKQASQPVSFRVMTYNIQHGAGMDRKVDLLRTGDVIKHEQPDIVAMEEVDKGVERTDRRDLTTELAAMTGMTGYFNNNFYFQGGEYGNAALTKFPILVSTNSHYQMIRPKEQRGVIQLVLDVKGRKVLFMVTHIDYRPDDTERLMNIDEIKKIMEQYKGMPMILCGDFNDNPRSRTYQRMHEALDDSWELVGQGDGFTFNSEKPNERIDYIWVSKAGGLKPVKVWVPDTQASDHRPLVADFILN